MMLPLFEESCDGISSKVLSFRFFMWALSLLGIPYVNPAGEECEIFLYFKNLGYTVSVWSYFFSEILMQAL